MKKLKYNGGFIVGANPFIKAGEYYKVDKNEYGHYQMHFKISEEDEETLFMTLYDHEYETCFEH